MNTDKKKLFISCPMAGRSEAAIRHDMDRMHKMAEIVFDQELEVIPTIIEDDPPEGVNWPIWYLGESIKRMAEADYFIGVEHCETARGCNVESPVARSYGIPSPFVCVREFMPDVAEMERHRFDNCAVHAPMSVCG